MIKYGESVSGVYEMRCLVGEEEQRLHTKVSVLEKKSILVLKV